MNATTLRRALLGLVCVGALLLTDRSDAQSCTTSDAAQRLYASDYIDSTLFGAYREDASFFSSTRGKPNVYFLLDNSSSMQRLPPNGPSFYAGTYAGWVASTKSSGGTWTFGSLPPLKDNSTCNGTVGDAADPGCAYKNLKDPLTNDAGKNLSAASWASGWSATMTNNTAVMGCGEDPISAQFVVAPSTTLPYGSVLYWFRNLKYSAPCDDYVVPNDGLVYDSTQDYADLAKACPTYDGTAAGSRNSKTGYDPDFYCGSGLTCPHAATDCGGSCGTNTYPNFFDKARIFHDSISDTPSGGPANGWDSSTSKPDASLTAQTFCDTLYGTTIQQGSLTKTSICQTCLNTRGFLFDGRLWRTRQENLDVDGASGANFAMPHPSIWLTGNFLNFYPPKMVIARKVMKDLLRKQTAIRVGIRSFDGSMNPYPSCNGTNDIDSAFNPKAAITWLNGVNFTTGTPTPTTMLAIGQSFHTNGNNWFSTTTTTGDFGDPNNNAICYDCQKTSLVLVTDGLPSPSENGMAGNTTATDADTKLAGDTSTGTNSIDITPFCPSGLPTTECDPTVKPGAGLLTQRAALVQVAWYLHNMDLRTNTELGIDCQPLSSKQVMDVYTLGFGANQLPQAGTMLKMAATAGGGTYTSADSPKDLVSALNTVMGRVATRATTFSVASISTLQSTVGSAVIVPRFSPVLNPAANMPLFYPGHLFRFDLYSEFTRGCTPNGTGDLDCDGQCSSVYLTDADGDFIAEDVTGQFFKLSKKSALCTAAKHCSSGCSAMTTAPANPFWDTDVALQHPLPTGADAPPAGTPDRAWINRPVYTVIDDNGDGVIDAGDTPFLLRPTDAVATKLLPYLNVGTTSGVCAQLQTQLTGIASTEAALVGTSKLECAKTIIRYVLGADVFNTRNYLSTGAAGQQFPVANQDQLADRADKLGDIFHSSPVQIDPPLPPDGVLCQHGLHNQCISSLWKTPTLHDSPTANAYGDYTTTYANRRKVVLVGANDGLIHALNGGAWHANADDPDLLALSPPKHTAGPPFNGYYDRGDGSELWSFLAPDMLPKIGLMLLSSVPHQIYVDGTPMVRDVWVDGSANDGSGPSSPDDQKQAREFHTVAVFGERRGGTHFIAFDVTNATEPPESGTFAAPKLLWIYPQPNSRESFDFGETYADFLPTPPPIGPVRIKADANGGAAIAGVTQTAPNGDLYHERWVVFLNGGFDPSYQRGRGVHMVDVWTGKEVWDFSKPAGGAFTQPKDPRYGLDFPVAAPVGMVEWGPATTHVGAGGNQGFFDTATFGDTGGQLWVLRFSNPAQLDSSGKATNWYGARVFQMGGVGVTDIATGLPFFYVTANLPLTDSGAFRVLAGTGDRYNLLDTYGGTCKVDNVRACLQTGCQLNTGATPPATLQASAAGLGGSTYTTQVATKNATPTRSSSADAAAAGCAVTGTVNLAVSGCTATLFAGGQTGVSLAGAVTCGKDAAGDYGCTPGSVDHPDTMTLPFASGQTNPRALHNWFLSLRVFEDTGNRTIFSDETSAEAYDGARLFVNESTQSTGVSVIDGTLSSPPAASLSSATGLGYALKLTHSAAVTFAPKTYTVNQYDERTSSPTAVVSQCAFFNTTQRAISESSGTCSSGKSPYCTAANRNINYFYGADAATGGLCGLVDTSGNSVRNLLSATLVPPPAPQETFYVNAQGQTSVGLTSVQSETGAQNIGQGGVSDPASQLEFLPITRDLHACRHTGTCN
jgi:type IV pilus assembly protein PilY1